jgi:MFS family permease
MDWSSAKKALYPWIICLIADLLFFYEFIQTNMFSAINVAVVSQFKLNSLQLSLLSSSYFYSSSILIIVAGLLLDRFSTKLIIISAMLFCSIGTLGFALSTSYLIALCFRFLSGIGNAFSLLACVKLASRWFPKNRLALLTGVSVAIAMAGGIIAQAPLSSVVALFGWRYALILDAVVGFTIIILMLITIRDYPSYTALEVHNDIRLTNALGISKNLLIVFKNSQNWLAAIYTALLNLPIFVLGALWGSLYLQQVYGLQHIISTEVISMLFIGTLIGAPCFGLISDIVKRRQIPMIFGSILSLLALLIVNLNLDLSIFELELLFFFLGLVTSSQIISYPLVAEHNPRVYTASAVSLVSLSAVLGGLVGQPIFGKLVDLNYFNILDKHLMYAHYYEKGMLFLVIAAFIALLCSFFVHETYCEAQKVILETGEIENARINYTA